MSFLILSIKDIDMIVYVWLIAKLADYENYIP